MVEVLVTAGAVSALAPLLVAPSRTLQELSAITLQGLCTDGTFVFFSLYFSTRLSIS